MLKADRIAELLQPYLAAEPNAVTREWYSKLFDRLEVYLELLLKWNAKTNLTSIREPEEIVRRHFGESLFVGGLMPSCKTLLDFGSGAGFPGIPIQLMHAAVRVTLAESQGKKAAFLREAVRALGLDTEVWGQRVESMAVGRRFEVVTMRAVDKMTLAMAEAGSRAGEQLMIVGTNLSIGEVEFVENFREVDRVRVPESSDGVVLVVRREMCVPRETP